MTYAEGAETARWLLLGAAQPLALIGKPSVLATLADVTPAHVPCREMTVADLSSLLGFRFERGVVAVARRPQLPDFAPVAGEKWLFCNAIHDATNIGALARSARCLGATGLVLGPGCGDVWSRRAVRAAVGHVFRLRLTRSLDPVQAVQSAAAVGLCTIAAHRGPLSQPVPQVPQLRSGWLLVLGNEDRGVAPAVVDACDSRWYLPMADDTDSLNVATAGALFIDRLRSAEELAS